MNGISEIEETIDGHISEFEHNNPEYIRGTGERGPYGQVLSYTIPSAKLPQFKQQLRQMKKTLTVKKLRMRIMKRGIPDNLIGLLEKEPITH
jgi:hypothetical protein